MARGRCVVFLDLSTMQQYEALARRVGESRSYLMRQMLERGLVDAEQYVRGLQPSGASQRPPAGAAAATAPASGGDDPLPAPPARRRGRPSRADRLKDLAALQALVQRCLDLAPDAEVADVRRLVQETAGTLGAAHNAPLLEEALATVFSQRAEDAPQPVGGNRPPE